jgi:hypothetical protein
LTRDAIAKRGGMSYGDIRWTVIAGLVPAISLIGSQLA